MRFWKARIEAEPPDEPFAVGLLHGPSGCGKSSLLKAGVLPRLDRRISTVHVDCIAQGTEARLTRALRRIATATDPTTGLVELMAAIRRGDRPEGKDRVLIVLDQFEQWLSTHATDLARTELLLALRQCDGEHLQCLLAVRQEFYLSAGRLFDLLEIGLNDQHNLQLLDLISDAHALEVLRMFGRAYRRLPARHDDLAPKQDAFLARAIRELQTDGRVVCVRLSLFAEMMKDRVWEPASLDEVKGVAGVGTTFLRETFAANPQYKPYRREVQALLRALLPRDAETAIAARRSRSVLLRESGLERNAGLFDRICELLDVRLHLITPSGPGDAEAEGGEPSYQFTHDYLVPSVREFLDSERVVTRRGRTEMLLERRTAQWTQHEEDRFLPSFGEFARILRYFPHGGREPTQRAMMRRATRSYGLRAAVLAAVTAMAAWGAWEANGRYQAREVVGEILAAKPSSLRRLIVRDLPPYRRWADRHLRAALGPSPARWDDLPEEEKSVRLRASLALAPIDPNQAELLHERLLDSPEEGMFRVIRAGLSPQTPGLIPWLEAAAQQTTRPEAQRLRAGLALAAFASDKADTWTDDLVKFLAARLLDASPDHQAELREDLEPIGTRLLAPLSATFLDTQARDAIREAAARMIPVLARDQPRLLAQLACEATPEQHLILLPRLADSRARAAAEAVLAEVARARPDLDWSEARRVELGQRRANAAILLIQLGRVGPALEAFHVEGDPEALTQFVHRSRDRGLRPEHLLGCLKHIEDEPARGGTDKERARFAILLALGEFAFTDLPESGRQALVGELAASYRNDPRSAIHGATGWLLRHWGFDAQVAEVDRTPTPYDPTGRREWFVQQFGGQSLTFIVFPSCPEGFLMGSPVREAGRGATEVLHRVHLTRPFAISDREISLGHWVEFIAAYRARFPKSKPFVGFDIKRLAGAATQISWNIGVDICRLLTAMEGLSEASQCYEDDTELESDSGNFPLNWSCRPERPGVRLPTEAEWEYACRAGTKTTFGFGSDARLLDRYAWFDKNSGLVQQPPGRLRPNLRGLFDMHGNVGEWCTDWYEDYPEHTATDPTGAAESGQSKIDRGGSWYSRWSGCRSASRDWLAFRSRYSAIGIRPVRSLPTAPSQSDPTARPQLVSHQPSIDGTLAARALLTLREHTDTVYSVAFSPDGTILATGSNDGKILLCRLADGRRLRILPANVSIACLGFNRDGSILASGNFHGDLQVWQVADGSLLHSIPNHGDTLTSLAFSLDGTLLAAGGNDRKARLWRAADWGLLRPLELPSPRDTSPYGLAFSPDGTRLAAGYDDSDLRIWRIPDGQLEKTLEECKKDINCVAFSPDGTLLAAGSDDHKIRLWRLADWKLFKESVGIKGVIMSLSFSPDGATLVTGSSDSKVRLWRVPDLERLVTLSGHGGQVNSVAFSPDGTIVASGSFDKTARLWKLDRPPSTTALQPGPKAR